MLVFSSVREAYQNINNYSIGTFMIIPIGNGDFNIYLKTSDTTISKMEFSSKEQKNQFAASINITVNRLLSEHINNSNK